MNPQEAAAPRRSFLIAGPTFTGIIDEAGKESWSAGRAGARDAFVLPSGNVLVAWADEVVELDRNRRAVFRYRLDRVNQEIGTAVRLPDGRTAVTELGPKPRLRWVKPDGAVDREFALAPETDNAHMQTRMARPLPNGDWLAPHLLAFKVKRYRPDGRIAETLATDLPELGGRAAENWPFTAIRLDNGNTLVSLTHGNKVAEFDPQGKIAWSVTNDDLPGKPLADPCGVQRLPNGNTAIACYGARGPVKIVEVTREKKIAWTYQGKHNAHELQILTVDGQPVAGPPLK